MNATFARFFSLFQLRLFVPLAPLDEEEFPEQKISKKTKRKRKRREKPFGLTVGFPFGVRVRVRVRVRVTPPKPSRLPSQSELGNFIHRRRHHPGGWLVFEDSSSFLVAYHFQAYCLEFKIGAVHLRPRLRLRLRLHLRQRLHLFLVRTGSRQYFSFIKPPLIKRRISSPSWLVFRLPCGGRYVRVSRVARGCTLYWWWWCRWKWWGSRWWFSLCSVVSHG